MSAERSWYRPTATCGAPGKQLAPPMALALTDAGKAEAYAHMELDDPPENKEGRGPAFAEATAMQAAADEGGESDERGRPIIILQVLP